MNYQEYREAWEQAPIKKEVGRVPIHLDLEVSTRCNYKCIMCEHSFDPPKPQDLDVDLAKKIIDEFADKGGCSIKFCYLGEPLLYPHLFELIKYAKDKGIVDTILATNGSLLDRKKIVQMFDSGLDTLILSIDSCNPTIYNKIRVGGNMHKIMGSLALLNVLRKDDKPKIQIQAIPMDLNREELDSGLYKAFYEGLCDVIRISPYCEDYTQQVEYLSTPNFNCTSVWRRMTVRADGRAALCCGKRSEDKILGDLYNQTIEDIWQGEEFTMIRQLMSEGHAHEIEACKRCDFRVMR